MKRLVSLTVFAMFLAAPLGLQAISLRDYTDPDTFYQEAYVSGSFSFRDRGDNRLSDAECPDGDCPGGQASYQGTALANYETQYSTLPFSWGLRLDGTFDIERSAEEGADSESGYEISGRTTADKYLRDTLVFGYGSFDAAYRKLPGEDDADDPYAKVGVGVGYGRVIDATVLAKALRSVEDLREYGVLTDDLSDSGYLDLASVIDREEEFQSEYGEMEYEKYWFEAMEAVFQEEGILADETLGALGVIRMREILIDEPISPRKHGWTIRGGVGYVLSNFDGSDSDPSLDAAFEYALPYTYRLQLIEQVSYSTILSDDPVHQINNVLSVTYEISDRIDWENRWSLGLTMPTESDAENETSNNLSSTFRYYISNTINVDATLSLHHLDDGIDNNGNDDVETGLFVGVTYRVR